MSFRIFLLALFVVLLAPSAVRSTPPSAGTLVVADWIRDAILLIDPGTGNRTVLSASRQIETCFGPGDPYPCCTGYDTGSGCAPAIGSGPDFRGPRGAEMDASGDLIIVDFNLVQIFRVNSATGDRTIISGLNMVSGCVGPGMPFACCTGSHAGNGTAPCVTTGAGPDFLSPHDVAVDSGGSLLVSDSGLHRITRVDPVSGDRLIVSGCADFGCISAVGSGINFGSGGAPIGIAVEAGGAILVVDSDQRTLFRVNPASGDRTVLSSNYFPPVPIGSGPGFVNPYGVALEADGSILVSDQTLDGVYRVDPQTGNRSILTGKNIESECTFPGYPFPCCTAPGIGDGTPPCAAVGSGPALSVPGDVALDSAGNILVTDSDDATFRQGAIVQIDPVTGDRSVVSSSSVGTGQTIALSLGMAVFPGLPANSIPTLSTRGYLILGLVLIAAALAMLRRRSGTTGKERC